ncbi:hypothetical protein [Leptospira weilii]|uniref:Uncharacterized protein n=1 Tax=Leptospira weilii str. 2006001855 TaxID=996804 RepID=M6FN93_9LEPT|nr:hypothetical protein [Leptospira weilii]EMM71589.1 hypothetical protein LEP1GSC038_0357 [Leptospira weilii str. 2006001855]EMN45360.1 hypothetical protein LEP1GSC086_3709 [Leptospira weilii str. LNT 1234]MCL8265550.1 hypothetical protein [Leptospira weilii]QDK23409.1 hypothetical protein FHG67_12270 [Leptospira weilii]QDK26949.1 hypothetical protein FHG68_09975 [Leptospira weilii]
METVYLEMIKFINEGSIFRVLLVLFSFFSFLLLAGVGFLWFKNPELISEILHTLSLKKSPEVIIEPGPQFHQVDLIRGLFSMSLDFNFTEKGANLRFPPYMRTRVEDGLGELLQTIVSSVREVSTENRQIEFDFTNTLVVNPYSANSIFEVIEDVQTNNGVYLVLSFRGKHLKEFEMSVRKLLSRSDSKSVNVRKRK